MTQEEFTSRLVNAIESQCQIYADGRSGPTHLGYQLDDLKLDPNQREKVLELIKLASGETAHHVICAIEGSIALDGDKRRYKLLDDEGNDLTEGLGDKLASALEGFGA